LFVRFTPAQRAEHWILMISFGMLAVTGLVQKFSDLSVCTLLIRVMGGIDMARYLHHIFALVLAIQSVYHVGCIIHTLVIRKEKGHMWPTWQDVRDAFQMIRFNLGLAKSRPRFGRYTYEEKMEYLAMIWGTLLMGITGLILWFPDRATLVLPGMAVPVSKALHGWEAILAVLAILTWHMYNVHIKTFNKSVFTGLMTEEEMLHEHPLEYEAIMAALGTQQVGQIPGMATEVATPVVQKAQHLFSQLTPEGQEEFLAQMNAVLELGQKRERPK
jgi:formate dehydrogenase gamma subunit